MTPDIRRSRTTFKSRFEAIRTPRWSTVSGRWGRTPRRTGRVAARAVAFLLLASFIVFAWPPAIASGPRDGDFFAYDYNVYLDQGSGEYEGYTETMRSHSRYDVQAVQGDNVTMHGYGAWNWEASDGSKNGASLDVVFTYSLTSRRYVQGFDLDRTYVDPAVWFWIPPPSGPGETVQILDDSFTVQELDASVWVGLVPHKAVRLEATGTYTRNDVYGFFSVTYRDEYYFDGNTGFIVAERYEERDSSATASFRWREDVSVTSASYPIPVDWASVGLVYGGIPSLLAGVTCAGWYWRRGPFTMHTTTDTGPIEVRVRRVRRLRDLRGLQPDGSRLFAAFLPGFARRAVDARDPVAIATSGPQIVGLLTLDREASLGSLFATNADVAGALMRRVRPKNYFVDLAERGRTLPGRELDTFLVFELRNPPPLPYDAEIVRPMTRADVGAVAKLMEKVYRGSATRWVSQCLKDGDLAFVAEVHGAIVGCALATVAGTEARFHSLTVAAEVRARGIGTELMKARLCAAAALGVQRVVVEISKNNAASLRVAEQVGFTKAGETYYYSQNPLEYATLADQRRI